MIGRRRWAGRLPRGPRGDGGRHRGLSRPGPPRSRSLVWGVAAYGRQRMGGGLGGRLRRLKDAPDDRAALRLLARSNARPGATSSAQRIFLKLGPSGWEAEDFYLIADALRRQGRHPLARSSLQRLEADPDHAESLELAARDRPRRGASARGRPAGRAARRPPGMGVARRPAPGTSPRSGRATRSEAADALGAAARSRPGARSGPAPRRPRPGSRWPTDAPPGGPAGGGRSSARGAGRRPGIGLAPSAGAPPARGAFAEAFALAGGFGADDPLRAEPAPFAGAAKCAECHREVHRAQQGSRHARTHRHDIGDRATARPIADPARPAVTHALRRDGDRLGYEVAAEDKLYRAAVEYVARVRRPGADLRRPRRLGACPRVAALPLRVGLGLGPHDGPGPAPRPIGRPPGQAARRRRAAQLPGLPHHPGGPDRGPARAGDGRPGDRLRALPRPRGEPPRRRRRQARRPGHRPAPAGDRRAILGLCGACHGLAAAPASPIGPDLSPVPGHRPDAEPLLHREPGGLSCVTCHDPHRDAVRDARHYEAKCLACHGPGTASSPARSVALPRQPQGQLHRVSHAGLVGSHAPLVVHRPRDPGPTPSLDGALDRSVGGLNSHARMRISPGIVGIRRIDLSYNFQSRHDEFREPSDL